MTNTKNRILVIMISFALVLCAFAAVLCGKSLYASAAESPADPAFKLINGNTGVNDSAVINAAGETELNIRAANGYGTRSNMSALGEDGMFDVRDFEAVVNFKSVPVYMSAVISLQTLDTGTIGAGNGNGIHVLLRHDAEDAYTVAIYDKTGNTTYAAYESELTAGDGDDITVSFEYGDETASITVASEYTEKATTSAALKTAFDSHYAEHDYRGYFSLASYYGMFGGTPTTPECKYVVREINGSTPRAHYTALVTDAITALEEGIDSLSDTATSDEIDEVSALNVFKTNTIYKALLAVADNSAALTARLTAAEASLASFEQKGDYNRINSQLDAFITALATFDKNNAVSVRDTRAAYEAIDYARIAELSDSFRTQLEAKNTTARAHANFTAFITLETDRFFENYEKSVSDSDAASLKDYKSLTSLSSEWEKFASVNALDSVFSADTMAAYAKRAENLEKVAENSFYSRFWTEGDSWNAELTEHGIRASGKGEYGETLGFKQKLTLGVDTSITFNVIYALKTLGANHLHIGLYPVVNTGTLGEYDGVRADFWFAGQTIEVKPVNGKTELDVCTAWLVVDDNGYYDMDDPQADEGKYTVEFGKRGNVITLKVNGLEMDIEGLDASLYENGCYMTISAMSVRGADPNDIIIRSAGGVNYDGYDPANDPTLKNDGSTTDPGKNKDKGCGCGSLLTWESASTAAILVITAFMAVGISLAKSKRRKDIENK